MVKDFMRVATVVGIGLGMLLVNGTTTAQANDTMATADGPILNGTVYEGTTGTSNDVDWWVFYTGATTELDIALLGLGPDDCFGPEMLLVDADGEVLDSSYHVNRNETEHIRRTVSTGTFYVEVRPNNAEPCAGPEAVYRLAIGSSPGLLSEPPYIPPPAPPPAIAPSAGAPSPVGAPRRLRACQRAQRQVRTLRRKLRRTNRRRVRHPRARRRVQRQRVRLRARIRHVRRHARVRC